MQHVYWTILGTTVMLAAGALAVAAQDRTAPPTMPMMPGTSQGGMMSMMNMADHVEGRTAFLKAELKITDAQLPQWNNFADALRSNARRMTEMRGTVMQGMTGQGSVLSAPERLDRMEKMIAGMLESLRSTKAALGPLYATLSDEQKKTADALLRGPMGLMGPM